MIIISSGGDPGEHPHINRFVDVVTCELYLIEVIDDYKALPQQIIDMLGGQWYSLQGLNPP